MVDRVKLKQLMATDAATGNVPSVGSMPSTDAADWCNSSCECRRNVPVNEFGEQIGDALKVQGDLKAARAAHDAGTVTMSADALEACDMFLTYCGQNVSAGAITIILAKAQVDFNRLSGRCDALMAPNDPVVLTQATKDAILALTEDPARYCDMDPSTVDLLVEDRQAESWLGNSTRIGWAHVEQARSIPNQTMR